MTDAELAVPFVLGNVDEIDPDADLLIVEPSKPALVDPSGKTVSEVTVGSQAVVAVNATNRDEIRDWACAVLVEIRDPYGVTVWLNWQSRVVPVSDTAGMGMSWTPEQPGTYVIRTFVISGFENPRLFSDVKETIVAVN